MTQYMMYPPNDELIQIVRHNEREMKQRELQNKQQQFWIEFLKRNEELQNDLVVSVNDLTSMLRVK